MLKFRLERYTKRKVIKNDYHPLSDRNYSIKKHFYLPTSSLLAVLAILASLFLHLPKAVASINADSHSALVNSIQAGELLIQTKGEGQFVPSLMQQSEVHFDITGIVANIRLKQSFHNDSTDWVEGRYVFPLPDQAAVNHLQIRIGERVIKGRIKEKSEAKKTYQKAKASGRKTGLIEQHRPNLFSTNIANIAPGETIVVELNYIQTVAYDNGQFSLRFPMTITPRYFPGVPLRSPILDSEVSSAPRSDSNDMKLLFKQGLGWAFNTTQVPDASLISPFINPQQATPRDPINPIKITAEINAGMPLSNIDSAYHNVVLSRSDNRYSLRLSEGSVSMEQDFLLTWSPILGREPKAAIFSEAVDNDDYALIMLFPTMHQSNLPLTRQRLFKEVIYVIDTSGSMRGVSIEQARKGVAVALDQLHPSDRFNIIEFNSGTFHLFNTAVPANAKNINHAQDYVSNMQARDGTEMLPAIRAALRDETDGFVRQVIFITDGAVGNEAELFKEINDNLASSRLFTVGIGSAPNSHFMRKAAKFGRGSFTHIGDLNEVQQKMSALFKQLNSPLMTNIQLRWPAGKLVESYPENIPDLYSGQPLIIKAKTSDFSGEIEIEGDTGDRRWHQTLKVEKVANQQGVASLWARSKISSLLDEITTGRNPDEVRQNVLAVALSHQLMSPYTSFVAVEKIPSRPSESRLNGKSVANTAPKGQSVQRYAYPLTATRSTQSLLVGILLLAIASVSALYIKKNERLA